MAGPAPYRIESIESAPFGEMTYILWKPGPGRGQALVIDPGFDVEAICELLDGHALDVAAILNTHGHADHIAGNAAIKQAYPAAPLIIGCNESQLLTDPDANLSAPFGLPLTSPAADRLVADGERLELAGLSFEVREIPGHSPGSVVFVCDQYDPMFVLGGDVLFAGSIGRTDLGGNTEQLLAGIRAKLFNLPASTLVYPGHGPVTTVGQERLTNPFVGEHAGRYRLS